MAERSVFLGCEISLEKAFRPRIETEFWAQKAVKENRLRKGRTDILDIFAGSGCIGMSFLKGIEGSFVDFVDISPDAVSEIKKNLEANDIPEERYKIIRSDFFSNIGEKKYDIILSNPPYVALDRIKEVEEDVLKRDPKEALFGGKDGMDCIRRFLGEVKDHLKKEGVFYMEFDPLQEKEIKKELEILGIDCDIRKDQFGKIRWLKGRRSK
jgi:HemK-like putative methylase